MSGSTILFKTPWNPAPNGHLRRSLTPSPWSETTPRLQAPRTERVQALNPRFKTGCAGTHAGMGKEQ